MRALFILLPAALALTACVEVDMNVEVLGADEARVTGYMQMNRQMFEMSGQDASFCAEKDGGTFVLTETHARCNIDKTGPFSQLMQDGSIGGADNIQVTLVHLDGNRVQTSMPFSAIAGQAEAMSGDPQSLAMAKQMLAGLSISFSVTGASIESTTGALSEDGTTATVTLTVDDLIAPQAPLQDFTTIATY